MFEGGKRSGSRNTVEKKVHVDVEYKTRVLKDELSAVVRTRVLVLGTEDAGSLLLRRDHRRLPVETRFRNPQDLCA